MLGSIHSRPKSPIYELVGDLGSEAQLEGSGIISAAHEAEHRAFSISGKDKKEHHRLAQE